MSKDKKSIAGTDLAWATIDAAVAHSAAGQTRAIPTAKTARQILYHQDYGIPRLAREVVAGKIGYYEAQSKCCSAACRLGIEPEDAEAYLDKAIEKYDQDAIRVERRIRRAVQVLFDRKAPSQEIRVAADTFNKHGFLSAGEVEEILKSEYTKWKQQKSIGNLITTQLHNQNPPQSMTSVRA